MSVFLLYCHLLLRVSLDHDKQFGILINLGGTFTIAYLCILILRNEHDKIGPHDLFPHRFSNIAYLCTFILRNEHDKIDSHSLFPGTIAYLCIFILRNEHDEIDPTTSFPISCHAPMYPPMFCI